MPTPRIVLALAAAAAAVSASAGVAVAAGDGPTTLTVSPQHQVAAGGDASPATFPGAKEARKGKPLPSGEVVLGRDVTVAGASGGVQSAFTLSCPAGKRIRSVAGTSGIFAGPADFTTGYVGKRKALFLGEYDARRGDASGTGLVLCR